MASRRIDRISNSDTDMSGILSLCLVSSTGVAITFISLLPLDPDTPSFQGEALYIAGKLSLSAYVMIVIVQLIRFIRNKKKYHENQTVFWPMRCPHCAFILGLSTRESSYTSPDSRRLNSAGFVLYANPVYQSTRRRTGRQNGPPSPAPTCPGRPQLSENSLSSAIHSEQSHQDSSPNSLDTNVQSSADDPVPTVLKNSYVYSKRNKSFLKIYGVLTVFALIDVPLTLAASMICIFKGGNSNEISMISSSIQSIVLITLIPLSIQFAVNYCDAVFARTINNVFTMVLFTSGAVWISIFKIATPISELLDSPYSRPDGPCEVNGTLAIIENQAVWIFSPFNAECAIIALCILWNMWASFVRRDLLCRSSAHVSEKDIFQGDSFMTYFKKFLRNCRVCKSGCRDSTNTFLHPSIQDLRKCLFLAWALSISFFIVYFVVSLYIERVNPFKQHFQYKLEVMWSIDIIVILPFFILYMHQSYVSRNSQETFAPISPRKVEAHDVLLLLCSCGIFCQCIMRLTASIGLLLGDPSEPHQVHYKVPAIYAIIFSLTIVLMIWQMTAYLLQVQGIRMTNLGEIKWVLVCLIYIAVANGVRWFLESIVINKWHVQCAFFGETAGSVVGTLLHPFATLYGLHAAVVSYEAYKSILQETLDQYTSVDQIEVVGNN